MKSEISDIYTYTKLIEKAASQHTYGPYPVDEEGLCKLDHFQSDQQADGDQVVV